MNLMINMNLVLEKELGLENLGYPRTSRYIGNRNRAAEESWYRRISTLVGIAEPYLGKEAQVASISTHPTEPRSILARLFHQPRSRRQSACENC